MSSRVTIRIMLNTGVLLNYFNYILANVLLNTEDVNLVVLD